MRSFFPILIAWALVAGAFVTPIALLQYPYLARIERIRKNPATTTGVFTAKDCANHASRSYAFEVDGKPYHGGGSSEAGGDCASVRIGAPILVRYEAGNPANNTGADPASELWNEIVFMLFVALIFPPIIIWRFRDWYKRGMPMSRGWK